MKLSFKYKIPAFLCLLLSLSYVNAQTHKTIITSSGLTLPANRTAFLYCYNSGIGYENRAIKLSNNKVNEEKSEPLISSELQNNPDVNISMFPNLTQDELWVEVKDKKTKVAELNLEIYNSSGKRVYNSRIEGNLRKINVCDFTAGTFLIKLGDKVQKMVIE